MEKYELSQLIEQRYTINELAKHFDIGKSTVRYWIKKHNLTLYRGAKGKYPKDHITIRKCSCGETDPDKFYGNKRWYCAKCHSKYTLEKGRKTRLKIIEYLGGKCINCGFHKYKTALQVHHLDSSKKDPRWSQSRSWGWDRIVNELKDCTLLCANCHSAHHSNELDISGL